MCRRLRPHRIEGIIRAQKVGIARRAVFPDPRPRQPRGKNPIPWCRSPRRQGCHPHRFCFLLQIVIGHIDCVIVIVVIQSVDNCGKKPTPSKTALSVKTPMEPPKSGYGLDAEITVLRRWVSPADIVAVSLPGLVCGAAAGWAVDQRRKSPRVCICVARRGFWGCCIRATNSGMRGRDA